LWPLSRELFPKQLLPLANETTMLQDTAGRLDGLHVGGLIVVCNEDHRFMVAEQLRAQGVSDLTILLEPVGRNTAPAAAVSALEAGREEETSSKEQDPVLLVLPADHVIEDVGGFQKAVRIGAELVSKGKLVTFGVVPSSPETGYGYIKGGKKVAAETGIVVDEFVEKPDPQTAEAYIASGDYFWNSGMFMFSVSRYLAELRANRELMLSQCQVAHKNLRRESDFVWLDREAFAACPSDSIDYAVMENTKDAVVIPIDVGWSDIGSWSALADVADRDQDGNCLLGDVLNIDSKNSYLRAEDRLLAAVGVENLVVVETADAVLVADSDRVQNVKEIVARLKEGNREESVVHRRVYRPWGSYEGIDAGEGWQVKCIRVNPGASLSLQLHKYRAEHWVVVKGKAEVVRGDAVFLLEKNESTFIPVGEKHRLSNPGLVELELIEVQSGSYLGEDDIIRFDDEYGR
jgi:mannose-1-phosphate guanylyltransferase/mannose-6-phosphate isomerase|tara:strand:- start:234 stop:1616 length:1383 start_codon:yes stop_codon:yes gene_type:complete